MSWINIVWPIIISLKNYTQISPTIRLYDYIWIYYCVTVGWYQREKYHGCCDYKTKRIKYIIFVFDELITESI